MVKQYYYGVEGQQFSFIQTPKVLVWHAAFAPLSDGAKLLYSIMLDRMSLSKKRGYIDEEDKVYIVMPNKEVMVTMGCGEHKAINLLRELEAFGLIQRRRLGQGRPSRIYVCNFAWFVEQYDAQHQAERQQQQPLEGEYPEADKSEPEERMSVKKQDVSGEGDCISSELHKQQFKNCISGNSRTAQTAIQELHEQQFKNCTNSNSRTAQTAVQELSKVQSPKENINNTVFSNETDYNETEYSQSVSLSEYDNANAGNLTDGQKVRAYVDATFQPQVIMDYSGASQDIVQELIELVYDVLICRDAKIRIGKADMPTEVVQSRYMKLDNGHLAYVLKKLSETPSRIRNVAAYLRTCLYEAPTVCSNYYNTKVNYDLYG